MTKTSPWFLRPVIYGFIALLIVLDYLTLGLSLEWMPFFFREDGYFEYSGALWLFISSAIMFYAFKKAFQARNDTGMHWVKLSVYLVFALLFFFGAGEEISWGQRILGIETPEALMEKNVQEEITIHNLAYFSEISVDDLFNVFWAVTTVLIPFLALFWQKFRVWAERYIPIVHWSIGILFTLNYLLAKAARLIYVSIYAYPRVPFAQAVQEIKESHYSFLLIFFSLYLLWDINQTIRKPLKTEA